MSCIYLKIQYDWLFYENIYKLNFAFFQGVNHVDTQNYPQPLRVMVHMHMDVTVCG